MKLPLLLALLAVSAPAFACDELGEMRRALAEARANSQEAKKEAAQRAYAQASLDMHLLETMLDLAYFPGLYEPRLGVVEIIVGGDAAYQAVSGRLPFLRGAPGAKLKLAEADRAAHIAALKADFQASLAAAAGYLRGAGENPGSDWPLTSLALWGVESSVGVKDPQQILTRAQRDEILKPAPAPERDPHE